MAGTLLGSGYIELSVKYKGALDQIRGDLRKIEDEGRKSSDVVKSHVERAVSDLKDGATSTLAAYQKTQQEWVVDVRKQQQAFKEFTDTNNAYFKERIGSEEGVRKALKAHKEAQDEVTDSYKRGSELSKKYFQELEGGSDKAAKGMGRISKAFGADMGNMQSMAPVIGAGIGRALVTPISLGIQGLRSVFTTVFEGLANIASSAIKGAMFGAGAAITGAIGSAVYTGIQRLDTLQEVRLKFKFDKISSSQTEQAIKDMRDLASKLSIPFNEMINQAEVFVAAGVEPGADLNRVMEDAANVAKKTGQSINSVSDSMMRFMQGHTQEAGMVLQTWQNNGFNILGGLATQLGVSNDMVIEMLQKGKISWAQVQREIESQLSGFAEQSGQTIAARLAAVWGKITDIGEAVLAPFFGSTVNGIQAMVDKLDGWAEWLRDHQPEIVEFVGGIAQKFFEAGGAVTTFTANVLEGFASIVRAGGTLLNNLPGWLGGDKESAQALFSVADGIEAAGDKLRESLPFWENGALSARSYFEGLQGATELLNAFGEANGKALDNGNIQVTGTAEQIAEATKKLDELKLSYTTISPGVIEVLPDTDEAKRLIDDFRQVAGLEPLFLDVYLRYRDPTKLAPDGTVRVPGEASRGGVGPTPNNGKPSSSNAERPWWERMFEGPGGWRPPGMRGAAPIQNADGSWTDPETGETWMNSTMGGGGNPKPAMPGVKGSPGQGFPISGYFNDPANPDGSLPALIPVDADPTPAVETVKVFTDGIQGAEPTPTPLTADLEKAESEYQKFADKVKNDPLSIPMIASMMFGGLTAGGMVGGIAPPGDRSGLKPQSIAALDAIQTQFPDTKLTSGFRATDPYEWHPDGRGLDLQVGDPFTPAGKARGDQLNAWILANKEILGVAGTLWQVADHFDHIHVSMKDAISPLLAAGGVMPNSGGPVVLGGGGGRPIIGGGMGGGGFPRSFGPVPMAPLLPGIDDQDSPTGPKPLPGDWKPTGIPGVDPNYTKPDTDTAAKGPNYTGDYADPNGSYLPGAGGFFDPNLQAVMSSPEVTPEEQARLQNALDKINDYQNKIAIAEQQLEELRNTKNVKPSTVMAKEQSIANMRRELDQAKTALVTLQDKVLEPAKGKTGKSGNTFWDQTLGEFVQSNMPDIAGLSGIAMGGLKETFMPPEFSDPTSWGLTQAAGGVMQFLGGVSGGLGNPHAAAALSMGSSALGGDGGGMGTSLMSILPYPFGTLKPAEDASVMPGVDAAGNQVHMPAGSVPGQPIAPGGVVNNDYSVNVSGDQTAIEENTVAKATRAAAGQVHAALPRSGG